jgi:hypothetical protein
MRHPSVPHGYVRATELATELGVETRRIGEIVSRRIRAGRMVSSALVRVPRATGGGIEPWLSPDAAGLVRAHYRGEVADESAVVEVAEIRDDAPSREAAAWPPEAALALAAAEGRAQAAEAVVGELRREVSASHGQIESLYRRVGELERATGQLAERVRLWREWYGRVTGASWWGRRRLPDAPEEVKPLLVE